MPAPIDYGVQVADPMQSFLSAFQTGATIREAGLKQEQQAQQLAQQKLIQEGFTKLRGPNATAADYSNLSMMLPKDQSDAVRKSFEMLSGERQNVALQQGGQVFSAFKAGKPEIAIQLMDQQIEGKRNAGDEAGAKFLETMRDVSKADPKAGEIFFGNNLVQMPGGDKLIEAANKLSGEARTAAEAPAGLRQKLADADKAEADAEKKRAEAKDTPARLAAEQELRVAQAAKAAIEAQFAGPLAQANLNLNAAQIKQINNNISNAAARLNLDQKTMQATVAEKLSSIQKNLNDLPDATRKLINDSAVAAAASKQSANQYNDLAKRLDEAGGGYGAATSFADYLRKQTGAQSPLTDLRQEYTRIRNSAAIKSLPAGPATDKDIELALKGIPPENADARTVASFLRGIGKMQDIEASVGNAKTDWLANNNGVLTRAKDTFIAGDYTTKPGETFNDFTQRVVVDVSKRYRSPAQKAEEDRAATMAKIPTTGTPAAAPTVNIRAQADAILSGGR